MKNKCFDIQKPCFLLGKTRCLMGHVGPLVSGSGLGVEARLGDLFSSSHRVAPSFLEVWSGALENDSDAMT